MLGLGEAGGRIAADLVAAGCAVRGWDPARRPAGIANASSDRSAVRGADVVLSTTTAAFALDAAVGVAGELGGGTLYADLNTASPQLKRELAAALPVQFADVALIGVVPSLGLATPALASGAGAERFAEIFRPLGMPVEVVGPDAGDAAGLKLLRSVFMKGIAAAAIESLEAARAAGVEDRVHADIAGVIGEPLLERLLSGSRMHAARRVDEMRAAAAYLEELGVAPRVASAAARAASRPRPTKGSRRRSRRTGRARSGSRSESLLATASTGSPRRMRLTGASSFLPVSVRGIAGTARIMSGTWRGESCERRLRLMLPRSSSSSATPSASTTKSSELARASLVVLEVDDEAVRDLRQLLDDAVELARAEADAAAVERRVRAARDDAAAALREHDPVALAPDAREHARSTSCGRGSRPCRPTARRASTASAW